MATSRVRESDYQIALKITRSITAKKAITLKMEHFAEGVVEKVKEFSPGPEGGGVHSDCVHTEEGEEPYATGEFIESITKRALQGRNPLGQYASGWAWSVGTKDEKANLIEYGTGVDAPGTKARWKLRDDKGWRQSPNTPTPEFAPFAKTRFYYADHGGVL